MLARYMLSPGVTIGVRISLRASASENQSLRAIRRRCFRANLIIYWLVTDGKTDRQTEDHSIYRASIASRGKKNW